MFLARLRGREPKDLALRVEATSCMSGLPLRRRDLDSGRLQRVGMPRGLSPQLHTPNGLGGCLGFLGPGGPGCERQGISAAFHNISLEHPRLHPSAFHLETLHRPEAHKAVRQWRPSRVPIDARPQIPNPKPSARVGGSLGSWV